MHFWSQPSQSSNSTWTREACLALCSCWHTNSTVRIFAGLDNSEESVRAALKKDLVLDYAASPEARRHMAQLLSVWDIEKHKAEAKLGGNSPPSAVRPGLGNGKEQAFNTLA